VKVARRKKAPFPKLAAEEALAALRWMHATSEVTAKQIAGAMRKREDLVAEIRARLEELGAQGGRLLVNTGAFRWPPPSPCRRRKPSAKALAVWRAQGRYMAAVRRLSKANWAKPKRGREAKSVGAAIAAAKRLAR
jgi:hypothetical protein